MRRRPGQSVGVVAVILITLAACNPGLPGEKAWSEEELLVLRSLALSSLPPLPPDPSNAVADHPLAREFGEALFFDPRLSVNQAISCATCHQPARHFSDGLKKGQAIGTSKRNTPTIVGTAYSPWLYWDGRRDGQWAQALSPLEDPNEQSSNRIQVVKIIANDPTYRQHYEVLFGSLPDFDDGDRFPNIKGAPGGAAWQRAWRNMAEEDRHAINRAFSNVGKAIAAFERSLMPTASRFDDYVASLDGGVSTSDTLLDHDEIQGLRLFIGKASCTQCHNGPLLTNNEFHNTGVLSARGEPPDKGRVSGIREAIDDPFNCLGAFSDDPKRQCAELEFVRTGPELIGAVRTPSLRNVERTAPYMHKGQLETLKDVLLHYNAAPDAMIGHNEAKPLGLSNKELEQLEAFLRMLSSRVERSQSESM